MLLSEGGLHKSVLLLSEVVQLRPALLATADASMKQKGQRRKVGSNEWSIEAQARFRPSSSHQWRHLAKGLEDSAERDGDTLFDLVGPRGCVPRVGPLHAQLFAGMESLLFSCHSNVRAPYIRATPNTSTLVHATLVLVVCCGCCMCLRHLSPVLSTGAGYVAERPRLDAERK